jgi:hypothetical protein
MTLESGTCPVKSFKASDSPQHGVEGAGKVAGSLAPTRGRFDVTRPYIISRDTCWISPVISPSDNLFVDNNSRSIANLFKEKSNDVVDWWNNVDTSLK